MYVATMAKILFKSKLKTSKEDRTKC
jgi:hypothetical protein